MDKSLLCPPPNQSSQGSEWLAWYIGLKSNVGKQNANALFLMAWHKAGSSKGNTSELRDYLSKNGVDIDKGILSSLYDTGSHAIDSVESIFGVGRTALYIVGGILIVGLAGMVYQMVRRPQTIGQIAQAAAPAMI